MPVDTQCASTFPDHLNASAKTDTKLSTEDVWISTSAKDILLFVELEKLVKTGWEDISAKKLFKARTKISGLLAAIHQESYNDQNTSALATNAH